jgi:hypothetical protein
VDGDVRDALLVAHVDVLDIDANRRHQLRAHGVAGGNRAEADPRPEGPVGGGLVDIVVPSPADACEPAGGHLGGPDLLRVAAKGSFPDSPVSPRQVGA